MITADVLVVGGGPAGSTLAWALRQAGIDVLVMDKAEFPRSKVCAGWVTPAVFRALDIDPGRYAEENVLQAIHGFRTALQGGQGVHSEFPGEPVSYGIRRIEFDNYLLQRSGARLLLGEPFKTMRRDSGCWMVNDRVRARLVVGAGGHFCPVARFIGAKSASETVVAAKEIEFELSPDQKAQCPVNGDVPELYFTPDCKGYGWVFRKGDYLNIGLGREDRHSLSRHVEQFLEELADAGRIPASLPAKLQGHAYLLYPHARQTLVDDGVMLIGDAAGLAYRQSGEGIRPAVESALLAAEVVTACQADYSVSQLQRYVARLRERFGEESTPPRLPEILPPRLKQLAAGWLMSNRYLSKNLLIRRWFLRMDETDLTTGRAWV
ncbi:MAG: NAD(P)/FAD-dependent oxidoreductase [Gammaproteobacteria bacterium]|nr:NAD(P)/FAD-dependent oxidoreductase [Gammaproteobacteria bacterium]